MVDPYLSLIQRIQAGDRTAFSKLYEDFFPKVYSYVRRRIDVVEDAEDVTSDVFLEMMSKIQTFQTKSKFSTWLYSIARHKVADYWRQSQKEQHFPFEDMFENILSSSTSMIEDFEQEERRLEKLQEKVFDLLDQHLNEKPRKLLRLRFLENLTLKEAASNVGMELNTAKVAQRRALKKLRTLAKQNVISI